jgi:hypothetical protein
MSTDKFTPDMIWQRRLNSSIIQKCLDLQRILGWSDAETFGIMACYLSDALEASTKQLDRAMTNQIVSPIEIVRDGKTERAVYLGNAAREMYEALKVMLASAVPHPVEHPTMTAAWKIGKAALDKAEGRS